MLMELYQDFVNNIINFSFVSDITTKKRDIGRFYYTIAPYGEIHYPGLIFDTNITFWNEIGNIFIENSLTLDNAFLRIDLIMVLGL